MFTLLSDDKYEHLFNSIEICQYYKQLVKLYIKSLKNNDPLSIIFIDNQFLMEFRDLIVDKFNLKKLYNFPVEPLNIQMEDVQDYQWIEIQGQTLNFKRIVEIIFPGNSNYLNIFTSKVDREDSEIYKHDGSAPISVYKFVHYAILEPVDKLS